MARLAVIALVCLTSSLASAGARYQRRPHPGPAVAAMAPAETAWAAAEHEPDASKTMARWRDAARAFDEVAATASVPIAVRGEAAYAALLAWKNALAVDPTIRIAPGAPDDEATRTPKPIPADDAALLASLTRYLELVPGAADAPEVRFLRANLLRRFDHFDEAMPDLVELVEHHPDAEVAEYAANLLVDGLIVAERYDEMKAWVDRMRADPVLLRGRDDLADRLRLIDAQWMRKQAEQLERDARLLDDGAAYAACADAYDRIVALDPRAERLDEVRYDAAVCAEEGGDAERALAGYQQLLDHRPGAALAARAIARSGSLTARMGRFAEAAGWLERYARSYAGEKDAYDAMSDAVYYRTGLGDTDAAQRDVEWFVKTFAMKRRDVGAQALAAVVHARLERGERAKAAALIAGALRMPSGDPDGLAALAWDAACPVVPTAGLCLRRGRFVRDATLARTAQARLARATTPRAMLLAADAALEAWATARPVDDAEAARLLDLYQRVAQAADVDPDTAILALARAGFVEQRRLHPAQARAAYEVCAAAAAPRPSMLAICDDGLRQTGAPPPIVGERLPAAAESPLPAPAPEAAVRVQP